MPLFVGSGVGRAPPVCSRTPIHQPGGEVRPTSGREPLTLHYEDAAALSLVAASGAKRPTQAEFSQFAR